MTTGAQPFIWTHSTYSAIMVEPFLRADLAQAIHPGKGVSTNLFNHQYQLHLQQPHFL